MSLSCLNIVKRSADGVRPIPESVYTDVVFVGDRSGSMWDMGRSPSEGASEFMTKYRDFAIEHKNRNIHVVMITFDDKHEIIYDGDAKHINASDIRYAYNSMEPRGTTRLYDTAMLAIHKQQTRINKILYGMSREARLLQPELCISFTLLTDGDDNMSHIFSKEDMADEIRNHKRKYNAQCFFAAANQNALIVGNEYGFGRDNSLQMSTNEEEAMEAFRACTNSSIRCASREPSGYTIAEREASCAVADYFSEEEVEDSQSGYELEESLSFDGRAMRC